MFSFYVILFSSWEMRCGWFNQSSYEHTRREGIIKSYWGCIMKQLLIIGTYTLEG